MFPWLINWAPDFRFPFSGPVQQDIAPRTIFGQIQPQAGTGEIEEEVFKSIASYGKQIGILTDIVLSLTKDPSISSKDAQHALDELKQIRELVEEVKDRNKRLKLTSAERLLDSLAEKDPEALRRLMRKYS